MLNERFKIWNILGIRNKECAIRKIGRQLDPKQLMAHKMGRERGKYVGRFYVPQYR